MALLPNHIIQELVKAITDSGIDVLEERRSFLLSINKTFRSILVQSNNPRSQLIADIGKMSEVERLADGEIPLLIYLQNIAGFLAGLTQEETVRKVIDMIAHQSTGAPRPNPEKIPEMKETIIHKDDTVTFEFMRAGLQTGASVMKLQVPSYEQGQLRKINGAPMIFLGTGWMLSGDLVITNHHVINARRESENNASDSDLHLQAKGTVALFDFNDEFTPGTPVNVQELVAWDAQLDYAVTRIPQNGNPRSALRCITTKLELGQDSIPVNIIQHPNGKTKRYGIRNNLVSASTDRELRYFTDTEVGTSGSPVCNDQWQVVALHRAALYVSKVSFQGKDTAYVNIGTHISLILEDIKARFPAIAAEINT